MNRRATGISLFVIGAIGLLAGGIAFFYYINSPAVGKVNNSLPAAQKAQTQAQSYGLLQAKNFSLQYMVGYSIRNTAPDNSASVASYLLTNKTTFRTTTIAINLVPNPLRLIDNSAYMFRTQEKSTYTLSQKTVGSQTIPIMIKLTGGYEETAFVQHAPWLLIISLTDNGGSISSSDEELTQVLSSLAWTAGN